ncbi:M56 family metallopeptidase [Chryseobacterium sp.]|uniref:M56 family metallopeptidase n=1 Tax=Chryseobacterium sp. TaxID=1871047 RepID=UPI00289A8E9C|nr:M56 family metallopeptidase [Chryseobacterium sp.]
MMEAVFFYLGKVFLCSGVMFLYYQLSLKDKTFHHYNRFYLLLAMGISILLPLIKVEDFTIEVSKNLFLLLSQFQNINQENTINNDYTYLKIIFSALGVVSLYFLGKFLYGIFRIQQLKTQFQKESFEGVNFYQTNLSEAPFSYFKNLFWKNTITLNSEVGKQILKHEMVHIEQKHSVDKIIVEIITSVFWFNPFFHIIKKEINLIHEYLADKKAVKQSDTKAFAQMLLASHFSGTQLPATSPFLSSNLKKRLKMLQKPKTKFGYARRIFALPVLFTVAFAYMVNAKNKEIKETNIEIDKAVSEIKKDTLSPKNEVEQIVQLQQDKISNANEKLKIQSEKLKTLSEKSKEKSTELKKIAKEKGENSYEFELKAKELKSLAREMDKIVDKDKLFDMDMKRVEDIRNNIAAISPKFNVNKVEIKRIFPEGDNYKVTVNGEEKDFDKIFDAKVFKELGLSEEKMKALKDKLNSPEFREKFNKLNNNLKNIPGNYNDMRKIADQYSLNGFSFYNDVQPPINKNLSKKELRKLEKLAKERAKVEEKLRDIKKQQKDLQGNPWMISVNAYDPKVKYTATTKYTETPNPPIPPNATILSRGTVFKTTAAEMFKANSDENIKYFVDGNPISKEEMQNINPKDIESMNVNKTKVDGKQAGEIHIKLKKK